MGIRIHLADIPSEGLEIQGQLTASVFDLPEGDPAHPVGPLSYDLLLLQDEGLVLLEGILQAPFELQCVRCLRTYVQNCVIDPYSGEIDPEGATAIDLVDTLREDLLLALPPYPHCNESDTDLGECVPPGPLHYESPASPTATPEGEPPNIWAALDQIDTTPS